MPQYEVEVKDQIKDELVKRIKEMACSFNLKNDFDADIFITGISKALCSEIVDLKYRVLELENFVETQRNI